MADHTCLDLLRRGKHIRRALPIEDLDPVGPAPGIDAEARWAVLESLVELDEAEQALAVMLFVDGLSQGEAADELGVSRVTVNKRAQRIRERLRISQSTEPRVEEGASS
jgi:RNA polymerase sigma factor (sigma-70 family)